MKNIDELTTRFKSLFERFLIGCAAVGETDAWDERENGEMGVFYTNDLVGVILCLIASDGTVSQKEAVYLDENFGFVYSVDELNDILQNARAEIDLLSCDNVVNGIASLRAVNGKLADAYRELLFLICDVIASSDGTVSDEEIAIINRLKAAL